MSPGSPDGDETGLLGGIGEIGLVAARWLRRLPDRLLHPLRRRRARERLAEALPDGPVLFVCHGNICRSPYAEAVLRQRARGRLEAASAGLMGPDRPSPETAVQVAGDREVDLTGHRSRLVSPETLRTAGLVVVMAPYQSAELRRRFGFRGSLVLGDLDPEPVRRRPIRDPIFRPAEVFHQVYDRIDRSVEAMLEAMGLPVEADPDDVERSERGSAHGGRPSGTAGQGEPPGTG